MKLVSEIKGVRIHKDGSGYYITVRDLNTGIDNQWAVTKEELLDIVQAVEKLRLPMLQKRKKHVTKTIK